MKCVKRKNVCCLRKRFFVYLMKSRINKRKIFEFFNRTIFMVLMKMMGMLGMTKKMVVMNRKYVCGLKDQWEHQQNNAHIG